MLGYTIASEIGDIQRFASPAQLTGYTARTASTNPEYTCATAADRSLTPDRTPALGADGSLDARLGQAPTMPTASYQHNKHRLGKQRVLGRASRHRPRLAEAIWHMLTRNQPFAPECHAPLWPHRRPFLKMPPERDTHTTWSSRKEAIESCVKLANTTSPEDHDRPHAVKTPPPPS